MAVKSGESQAGAPLRGHSAVGIPWESGNVESGKAFISFAAPDFNSIDGRQIQI